MAGTLARTQKQQLIPAKHSGKNRPKLTSDLLSPAARQRLDELILQYNPLGEMLAKARQRRATLQNSLAPASNGTDGAQEILSSDSPAAQATHHLLSSTKKPQARARGGRDLRLPAPGHWLRREYKGKEILVRVLENGFEFESKRYESLSAIAKKVTGAHWNGLLFFGLVKQKKSSRRT